MALKRGIVKIIENYCFCSMILASRGSSGGSSGGILGVFPAILGASWAVWDDLESMLDVVLALSRRLGLLVGSVTGWWRAEADVTDAPGSWAVHERSNS